jgi:uncharacterized protein
VTNPPLPDRLRADLKAAMRARDQASVRALRSVLAAFANAEAPPLDGEGPSESYGALVEHERLVLTDEDHRRLLEAEIAERRVAAAEYDGIDRPDEAAAVRAEIAALEPHLVVSS